MRPTTNLLLHFDIPSINGPAFLVAALISLSIATTTPSDATTTDPGSMGQEPGIVVAKQTTAASTPADHVQHQATAGDHEITPAMFEELREKIPVYREMSDTEVLQSMAMMPNFQVYLSHKDLTGNVGVLALAHGFGAIMNAEFEGLLKPVAQSKPTAVAYGMAMMTSSHYQTAVDQLVAAGAKRIVVVPVQTLMDSKLFRQWQYIFGLRDESQYMSVPRVETEADIIFAEKPTKYPVVAKIMLDHALELSVDPKREVLILISHGPVREEDNVKELAILKTHAAQIREHSNFSEIKVFSMQDDAPSVVRDANVRRLRSWIEQAEAENKTAILVTNLILLPRFADKLRANLEGLDYQFNAKGVVQHSALADWFQEIVKKESANLPVMPSTRLTAPPKPMTTITRACLLSTSRLGA